MKEQLSEGLSVIIVDYQTLDTTLNYIDSCIQAFIGVSGLHFVIVDHFPQNGDASLRTRFQFVEETASYTRYQYRGADIVYSQSDNNAGYAKGNNKGVRLAAELFRDRFYLFSNNDILFPQPVDWRLIQDCFAADDRIAVVGTGLTGPAGTVQNPGKRPTVGYSLFYKFWKDIFGNVIRLNRSDIDKAANSGYVYRVSGAFMFVRADSFHQVGMFDENTFLFAEEEILSERLRKLNYFTYYCKEVQIIHHEHQSLYTANMYKKRLLLSYDSERYYFRQYREASFLLLFLADINRTVYCLALAFKNRIKEIRDGEKK